MSSGRKITFKLGGKTVASYPRRPLAVKKARNFKRQLKALIASKKKDAADVTRDATVGATTIACLTSSTAKATAASGTGLLDMDGDEALINSVKLLGTVSYPCTVDITNAGDDELLYRQLVVWFNKPLLVASAAGTLPPITEVLVTDSINSMPVTSAANGGRFVILSDKIYNLGTNIIGADTAVPGARINGRITHHFNYRVKVNKSCKFAANGVSGAPSGHYDSDVAAGRIDKGLLILYEQTLNAQGHTAAVAIQTRLNYTG